MFIGSVTILLVMPLAVSLSLNGAAIMTLIYGAPFSSAGPVLGLLMWQVLFILLNAPLYVTLIARARERTYLHAIAIGAAATIALNLVVVPHYGAVGAAVVAVFTELFVLGFLFRATRGGLPPISLRSLGAVTAVVLVAALLVAMVWPGSSLWRAIACVGAGGLAGTVYLWRPLRGFLREAVT